MFKIWFFLVIVMILIVFVLWLLISPFFKDIEKASKKVTKNIFEEENESEI
jgi:hypothetical protein